MVPRQLTNQRGQRLDFTVSPGRGEVLRRGWLVLLGHGVTGNKDRPVIADTAHALNAAGFDTLRLSFAGNGASEGDFRKATITNEVRDLTCVLDAVSRQDQKICYLGHSMGAAVGVLLAAKDQRIDALVSLAGMVDTKTFAETEFGAETPDVGLMWEEASCPLSSAFMQDLRETVGSVAPAARAVRVPWLLVHGTADDVVPLHDTEEVAAIHGDSVQVVFVQGADHSFNEPEHKAQMTQAVVGWLVDRASQ